MRLRVSVAVVALAGFGVAPAAAEKPDHSELSKLIQQAVASGAPKVYEDRSQWGMTIPPPDRVLLPRLKRVMIGGEVPHGYWKRNKVWLDEPAKDIQIVVRELKPIEGKKYRLVLEATVALHAESERQRWQKGVKLLGISVQADAVVTAAFDCDVSVAVDASKFPPQLSVEPKVVQSRLELKQFDLNRVGVVLFDPELARELGNELKGVVQELMRSYEPDVKERANQAIAKALQEGKGKVSAEKLLKFGGATNEKEK